MTLDESYVQLSETVMEALNSLGHRDCRTRAALRETGWDEIGSSGESYRVGLGEVKNAVGPLRDMAANHPLHKRGAQLRHAYIFGRGIEITGMSDKASKIINDTVNQSVLFSVDAQERLNLESFCAGNIFVFRNKKTNRFTHVPIEQIVEIIYDDFDTSYVRYVRREWYDANQNKIISRWFPTSDFEKNNQVKPTLDSRVDASRNQKFPVDRDHVVYIKTSPAFAGSPLGIPDSLAGALWSVAYSNYLSDSAALTHILKQVAWKITRAQNKEQADKNAVLVGRPGEGGVGATVGLSGEQQINSVGVPSAQVDFNGGQPLAAMTAASFGVPVIALLSSPGATGGSYGAATTLDEPTRNGFKAAQDSWIAFYLEVLRDINPKTREEEIVVSFPSITEDPPYRQLQSIAQAYATGAIFHDEYREAAIDTLGIKNLHPGEEPPETPDFNGSDPIPRQGNTGALSGGVDQGDTNHDDEN